MSGFRHRLYARLLVASAVGSLACSTEVRGTDDAAGGGGAGGTASHTSGSYPPPPDNWTGDECFAWPQPAGAGGAGGSGGSTGGNAEIPPCPPPNEAGMYMSGNAMICPFTVASEGTYAEGECCYTVDYEDCGVGRPFLDEAGRAVTARRARSQVWTAGGAAPRVDGLSPDERALLARRWLRDALLEHASVASFGRFALELLAVGAPAELVARAHEAALDEVRHARRCFDLARAYGAEAADPGPMPFGGAVLVSSDPADIARRTVIEGCVGETLAAVLASEQHQVATDPAVRATLAVIAEDEARHAELAWAAVTWLIERGGEPVRRAVRQAFADALARPPAPAQTPALDGHGLLGAEAEGRVARATLAQLVAPLAARIT